MIAIAVKCNEWLCSMEGERKAMKRYHDLSSEEERILRLRGTERPGSGPYLYPPGVGV